VSDVDKMNDLIGLLQLSEELHKSRVQ